MKNDRLRIIGWIRNRLTDRTTKPPEDLGTFWRENEGVIVSSACLAIDRLLHGFDDAVYNVSVDYGTPLEKRIADGGFLGCKDVTEEYHPSIRHEKTELRMRLLYFGQGAGTLSRLSKEIWSRKCRPAQPLELVSLLEQHGETLGRYMESGGRIHALDPLAIFPEGPFGRNMIEHISSTFVFIDGTRQIQINADISTESQLNDYYAVVCE